MKKKAKFADFVLDGSITLAWFFEDESNAYADSVEEALVKTRALVPALWHLEVVNALLMGERRKRTTEAKVTQFLTLLQSLPIVVDEATMTQAWGVTLHLPRGQNLSAYDAAYLELALRRGLSIATLDDKVKAAAASVGVDLYQP
jgi:predicted nucleic acid-binding protein